MRYDRADLNADTDPLLLQLKGLVRRMAITLTVKALWQLAGFRLPDGKTETRQVEPFTGIGFYSRPPSSGKPEAIAVMVGDSTSPAIVATRDEKTRSAVAGGLQEDETMLFNSQAVVHATATGEVHMRSANGVAADAMIRGTTYRGAEDTLFTAVGALAAAVSTFAAACVGPTGAQLTALQAACTAMVDAVTAFQGGGATYLSPVGKVQ